MAAQQGRVALVRKEALEAQSAVSTSKLVLTIAGEIAKGLLEFIVRGNSHQEQMEKWARMERVTWYEGCGR